MRYGKLFNFIIQKTCVQERRVPRRLRLPSVYLSKTKTELTSSRLVDFRLRTVLLLFRTYFLSCYYAFRPKKANTLVRAHEDRRSLCSWTVLLGINKSMHPRLETSNMYVERTTSDAVLWYGRFGEESKHSQICWSQNLYLSQREKNRLMLAFDTVTIKTQVGWDLKRTTSGFAELAHRLRKSTTLVHG